MKNTITLLFAKMFEKGITFLFFMLLAQTFGKEVFGEFSYYFTIATLLFVLFDLGGEFYQIREFSKIERLKNFNTIFLIKSAIFLIIFATTFIITNNIYLLLLLGSYYLDSIISIFRSSLYKNGHYILESKFTIIEKSIFIVIVFANILSIQDILVMYFAFLLSKFIYVLILSKKFYKFRYILKTKRLFDLNFAKYYLTNAWSYVLHALLVVVFVQIDIIMLKQMNISFGDIGLYSAAVKIYMTVIIFADVLFKLYYPLVAKYVQNGEQETLKKLVLKIQDTNLFFSIYFAIITMLFAPEIISLAFGDEFVESSKMLILLSIIIIFRFSMYTYTAILSSSNLNYIKLYTSLACVVTNIVLNYILIPIYGVYGAIIATVLTEILLVVLYKISSFKVIFTNILTKQEIAIILFGVLMLFLFLNYHFSLLEKSIFLAVIAVSMIFNIQNIKTKLNFQKVINE
ncbi:polysaccharide biosynthesis C-terminal domain-containing protein [Sulfurimonas sp.]|uniref:oligosaccharide flippase family protein n=1 Tax=Sulfurimonas sp. TaxID=2022749 RepID=UPI0019E311D0|nr:polysaccharide biosynthesis C-terminal domain-containing protein [Sulfurimonas sp.]MBE0515266.1 polysaccharide biosynthesis C-terminal domain-containing protein [Sulfurimonas sp.]